MKKNNWVIEIAKGLLIFIFGLFCLVNPTSATVTLTWIFAIMILIMSIVAITDAFMLKNTFKNWWIFLLESLVGVSFVAILFFNPEKMMLVIRLVGSWAIVTGIFRGLRVMSKKDMWLKYILVGLGFIVAGILFLVISEIILNYATIVIGVVAALFGLVVIILGVRMKNEKEE